MGQYFIIKIQIYFYARLKYFVFSKIVGSYKYFFTTTGLSKDIFKCTLHFYCALLPLIHFFSFWFQYKLRVNLVKHEKKILWSFNPNFIFFSILNFTVLGNRGNRRRGSLGDRNWTKFSGTMLVFKSLILKILFCCVAF